MGSRAVCDSRGGTFATPLGLSRSDAMVTAREAKGKSEMNASPILKGASRMIMQPARANSAAIARILRCTSYPCSRASASPQRDGKIDEPKPMSIAESADERGRPIGAIPANSKTQPAVMQHVATTRTMRCSERGKHARGRKVSVASATKCIDIAMSQSSVPVPLAAVNEGFRNTTWYHML